MAVLAFSAVGALAAGGMVSAGVIAASYFGIRAVSIGWMLGGLIGGAVQGPTNLPMQVGPQLGDLKVQISAYGSVIPRTFGTVRVAGNVIWAPNLVQTANVSVQRSGGKGGGGSTQTNVTYTYSASFAIALCEGEIIGIAKVWANGNLIRNVSDDAETGAVLASYPDMTVYTGSETQTADPLIEAHEGAGNVPGFRGTAYVVFSGMQLAAYGNRIPNLEFEVVKNGVVAATSIDVFEGTGTNDQVFIAPATVPFTLPLSRPSTGLVWATRREDGSGHFWLELLDIENSGVITKIYTNLFCGPNDWHGPQGVDAYNRALIRGGLDDKIYRLDTAGNLEWFSTTLPSTGVASNGIVVGADNIIWGLGSSGTVYKFSNSDFGGGISHEEPVTGGTFNKFLNNSLIAMASNGRIYGAAAGSIIAYVNPTTMEIVTTPLTYLGSYPPFVVGDDTNLYRGDGIGGSATVEKYDQDGIFVDDVAVPCVGNMRAWLYSSDNFIWAKGDDVTDLWVKIDAATMTIVDSYPSIGYTDCVGEAPGGQPIFFGEATYGKIGLVPGPDLVTSTSPTLASVMSELILESNLVAGDIDVTDLATTYVDGYIIAQRGTIRSGLEPLMGTFFVGATESDDKIRFTRLGVSSIVSIPEADLGAFEGAGEGGGGEVPNPLNSLRGSETELPIEVNISYMSRANNYQVLSQPSRRTTRNSQQQITIQVPIVLTDDHARQVADTIMYLSWMNRTSLDFATTRKYSKYDPLDVVTLSANGFSRTVRLTQRDEGANGVMGWQAVLEDISIFIQTSSGGAPSTIPRQTISAIGPSSFMGLDIPLLRRVDDVVGFYFGVVGSGDGWIGAQLYQSVNGGGSFEPLANAMVVESLTKGFASADLTNTGMTADTNERVDEINFFTVVLSSDDELESITYGDFLAGGNLFLVGKELVQAMVCTLTASRTYKCTRLLRGRLGTEWAITEHIAGERVVVINTRIRTLTQSADTVNNEYLYKPVSNGRTLGTTNSTPFTNTDIRKQPLSPVHLGAGRNASLDLLIQWVRRTRDPEISWNTFTDPQLLESAEMYAVDIYNGAGSVVRTISSTVQSATYTVAQQTADFGSAQPSIPIGVCQISPEYGRGRITTGTF